MINGLNVLIVDDEPDFLGIVGKFLHKRGVHFEAADCCLKGIEKLGVRRIHVVVMDVKMPGIDGINCMSQMKKLDPGIQVIILTGHGALDAGLLAMKNGAFDYCLKPVDFDQLFEKIILAGQRARESGQA